MDEEDFIEERFKEITNPVERAQIEQEVDGDLGIDEKRKFIKFAQNDHATIKKLFLHLQIVNDIEEGEVPEEILKDHTDIEEAKSDLEKMKNTYAAKYDVPWEELVNKAIFEKDVEFFDQGVDKE